MTKQEIEIAIAKVCGWKRELKYENSFSDASKQTRHEEWKSPKGYFSRALPDYTTSLDACAEFERTITETQRIEYGNRLAAQLPAIMGHYGFFIIATATPLQRCEAFLRLHNKRKEG